MENNSSSTPQGETNNAAQPNQQATTPLQSSAMPISSGTSNKKQLLLIAFSAMLLAAAAAGLYVFVFQKTSNNKSVDSVAPVKQKQQTGALARNTELRPVSKLLESTVPTQTVKLNSSLPDGTGRLPSKSESDAGTVVYIIPRYKLDNYPYMTDPIKGYGNAVSTQTKSDGDKTYNALISYLKKDKAMVALQGTATDNKTERSQTYASKETVCHVKETYTSTALTYVGVGCGQIASYREAAATIKPFHEAYTASQTTDVQKSLQKDPLYYGIPTVKTGQDGYKRASLSTGAISGTLVRLFYLAPNSNWKYFINAADQISCDEFKTADLQKAFAGLTCVTANGESVTVPRTDKAKSLVNDAKKVFKLPIVFTKKSSEGYGLALDGSLVYSVPRYKLMKYDYQTDPNMSYGFGVSSIARNKTAAENDYKSGIQFLEKNGLKVIPDYISEYKDVQRSAAYIGKDTICMIRLEYNVKSNNRIGFACANIASYEETAKLAKPFHDAYVAAQKTNNQKMNPSYYWVRSIKEGIEGYKRAEVSFGKSVGLFYQLPKSTEWKYLMTIVDQIQCADFKAADLQKAFAKFTCVNANGDFVTLPRANKAQSLINDAKKQFVLPQTTTRKADNTTNPSIIGNVVYFVPHYKLKNYTYQTDPAVSYGFAVSTKTTNRIGVDFDYNTGVELLKSQGMKEVKGSAITSKSFKTATYANKEVVCSISVQYDVLKLSYVDMGCGDITSFENEAEIVKPFHDAYVAVQPKATQSALYYSQPKIENGQSQYKRATLSMSVGTIKSTGLFYQEPSGNWKYFTNIVDQIACSKFNTPQLKLAFAGWTCTVTLGKSQTL